MENFIWNSLKFDSLYTEKWILEEWLGNLTAVGTYQLYLNLQSDPKKQVRIFAVYHTLFF